LKCIEGWVQGSWSQLIKPAWPGELSLRNIPFEREVSPPIEYEGIQIDCSYRLDFVVAGKVVIELKAVDALQKVPEAQLLTYLRLSGLRVGLLINLNVAVLKEGIRRLVL